MLLMIMDFLVWEIILDPLIVQLIERKHMEVRGSILEILMLLFDFVIKV